MLAFFLLITHVLYRPESETATNVALDVALALAAGDPGYALDVLTALGSGRYLTRGNIICFQIFLYYSANIVWLVRRVVLFESQNRSF